VAVRVAGASLLARDLRRMRQHPTTSLRLLFFPLLFVIVITGTFGSVTELPGFPTTRLLDWVLPTGFVAAAVSAATIPVFAMARDCESGFFDRLQLTPVHPLGLVMGAVVAGMIRAFIPFVIVLSLGLVVGVHLPGGAAGVVTALVAAEGIAVCAAAWGIGVALRIRSVRKTIGPVQLVNFLVLYISSAQVPLAFMNGWLKVAARLNPMTQVLALARQGFIGRVTWPQTWPGLVVLTAGGCLLMAFAVRGLNRISRA